MLKRLRLTHTLALLAFAGTLNAQHSNHDHSRDHRQYEFIPNKGQDPSTINYSVKLVGGKMFVEDKSLLFYFTDNSALLKAHYFQQNAGTQIKRHAYRMTWVNAQKPVYNEQLKTKHYYNFFKGKVRSKWAGEVHAYNALGLKQLYPGISLKFETNANEKLEYTYTVAPGASPLQIIQQYDGVKVSLARNGDLLLETSISVNQELKPVAWQMINGKKVNVACRFKLHNNRVTFDFPKGYDEAYELIIDPVLIFGSYSGSTADNFGMTATYDYEGNLYSGGTCFDMGFPTTTGAYDSTSNPDASATGGAGYGVTDVVITKYSSDGSTLIYSTYLGGGTSLTGTETVHSLIVNNNNELMCFGATSSTDFPVTATAYDTSFNGGSTAQYYYNGVYFTGTGTDIYVAKFNLAGSNLLGCTFVGGSANDGVNYKVTSGTYSSVAAYDSLTSNYGDQFRGEIMTDAIGNIYIASTTRSSDFPTMNAFQPTKNGSSDAVVFKLDPTLTTLLFSTFLGGSGLDAGYSVKLDNSGNVFIAGGTGSNDFPVTAGTHHDTYQGGKTDGFIVKMSPSGSSMVAGSYVGTNLYDQTMFVEIDKEDNVYLYGNTLGMASWPITPGVYSNANSGQYILKLDSNLVTTIFSTLFGNSGGTVNISPSAFLVDVCGNIYVSGWGANILLSTPLSGMPVTSDAYLGTSPNGYDFYLACFQRDMQGLLYATYFGGGTSHEHVDGGTSRFDKYGIIYQSVCAGCCVQVGATVVCSNDDFPTTPGAWSNTNNSSNCNNGVF
ncbi:MAG TPA: hypothetical protein VK177_09590, partial [Flavobacteriales bacterium]|nr:hypothetical protein [Flavobacteriales bacterium]